MATVTRENIGTLHDKITVRLGKDDFMPAVEKKLKDFGKQANIPGFRKGMVPTGMVRKMYGPTIFNEEVIHAAGHGLEDYLKKENVAIFAQPMIMQEERLQLDINNPGEVDFSFEIGLKPDFNVKSVVDTSHLTRYKINVTDAMLDDEIKRLQLQHGAEDEQTEVTTGENFIHAGYALCDDQGYVADDVVVHTDTKRLDKMPAKLQELLMGKKTGDSLVIRPSEVCTEAELGDFLKNVLKADEASAELNYKLTIDKIGLVIPETLGAEFYAKVFKEPVTDEADFRNKLRAELEREYARITGERLHNEIFEFLVHNTPIELPVNFLKRWMREGGEKRKSAEEVEEEFGSFEHQLRWQLISDQVITQSGINVSREEIEHDIKTRVMSYFGMGPGSEDEMPWIDSYMSKMVNDEKMMDETYRRLLASKLFSVLEGTFPVEVKEIEEEAFFKLGDAHAAHHHHHDH